MQPEKNVPNDTGNNEDDIFVVKPEPKPPTDKRMVWLTTTLTVVGIFILLAVAVGAFIASAGSLARDYEMTAYKHIKKLDPAIKTLEPSDVLNNRNISPALNTIYVSKQSQPALVNTLFVGDRNPQYRQARQLEISVHKQYTQLDSYSSSLNKLLNFDDQTQDIYEQEIETTSHINTSDSLSLRSASGSFDEYASKIRKIDVSKELEAKKASLLKTYSGRSAIYASWAKAVESGDTSKLSEFQDSIQKSEQTAASLRTDKSYVSALSPTYKNILQTQKTLETKLSN